MLLQNLFLLLLTTSLNPDLRSLFLIPPRLKVPPAPKYNAVRLGLSKANSFVLVSLETKVDVVGQVEKNVMATSKNLKAADIKLFTQGANMADCAPDGGLRFLLELDV